MIIQFTKVFSVTSRSVTGAKTMGNEVWLFAQVTNELYLAMTY